ncbi:hypothetical protein [Caballeronia sp. 15715]|uniref:hypothetical protein n=1 Tax=unclassified Caballeronia TaxID=2646786 RepID=UPI0039E58B0B
MSLHVFSFRSSHSFRSVFTAVSLITLGVLFHVSPGMAATSIDPRVYSSAPFAFKADRGIFAGVPTHQIDARIFSPVTSTGDITNPTVVQEHVRLRHDL